VTVAEKDASPVCCIGNYQSVCPILDAHDKYLESWHFLREMARYYHVEKPFRYSLNAFLQALKSVAELLVKNEVSREGLRNVYGQDVKKIFRAQPILDRCFKAREFVVHRRMLSSKSKIEMGLFRGRRIKLAFMHEIDNPFIDTEQIFEKVSGEYVDMFIGKDHPAIGEQFGINRQWIVDEIGDVEILQLCIGAFTEIGAIMEHAHKAFGFTFAGMNAFSDDEPIENYTTLLETDVDPSLFEKWGWVLTND